MMRRALATRWVVPLVSCAVLIGAAGLAKLQRVPIIMVHSQNV